jgi:hypothetical protein
MRKLNYRTLSGQVNAIDGEADQMGVADHFGRDVIPVKGSAFPSPLRVEVLYETYERRLQPIPGLRIS